MIIRVLGARETTMNKRMQFLRFCCSALTGGMVLGLSCNPLRLQQELDVLGNVDAIGSLLYVPISLLVDVLPQFILTR